MIDGALRIACVADTHSAPHPRIGEHLDRLAPAAILHAGDIGDLAVLAQLAEHAPLHAVRGNIDTKHREVPEVEIIEITDDGVARLRIYMTHIAVYGPRLRAEVSKAARAAQATLVVCGHSHVPFIGGDKHTTVFNPGSIGPRRFQLPICFGAIDLTRERVRLTHYDCETGEKWLPPR